MSTAGQIRQLNGGFGTDPTCGDVVTEKHLDYMLATPSIYFSKKEPGGIFMEKITQVPALLEESRKAVLKAANSLVDTAKESNKAVADTTGKMRDSTEKLGLAIDRLMKVAGRPDFAAAVANAEAFVSAMERLAKLEEKGLLEKVMKSLRP